jgi:hypothetical protein
VRFLLSTFGISIAVAVLLVGASLGTMAGEHRARENADAAGIDPVAGVDPLYFHQTATEFRGEHVEITYVHAGGDNPPVPDGIRELPGPGEVLLSPGLAALLDSPEGELLRPRFAQEVVGELGRATSFWHLGLEGSTHGGLQAGSFQCCWSLQRVSGGSH